METESAADFVRMTRDALAAAGFVRRTVDDVVYWERDGAEPPVVLVHGVNDHAGTWFSIAPYLTARRVVLPDLAGHGESGPAAGPLPMSLLLSSLEAVIGRERDIVLLGNSLGGWVATLYALAHPDRVQQLVLESAGGLARPFASPVTAASRDEAIVVLRAVHGPRFDPPDWVIESLIARSKDSQLLRVTEGPEHALDGRLAELRLPVTLLWGADDGVLPLSYARELQSLIPSATLHVIEGAAHIPHLQQPEKFLQCLSSIF
ncbi:MAG TPA: alpha/beta fold hydrolase [Thermoanaerobaculia bacterium]|nr:alpha/beta fold hydrolase [Thermoanaerobaculia bacterium]